MIVWKATLLPFGQLSISTDSATAASRPIWAPAYAPPIELIASGTWSGRAFTTWSWIQQPVAQPASVASTIVPAARNYRSTAPGRIAIALAWEHAAERRRGDRQAGESAAPDAQLDRYRSSRLLHQERAPDRVSLVAGVDHGVERGEAEHKQRRDDHDACNGRCVTPS